MRSHGEVEGSILLLRQNRPELIGLTAEVLTREQTLIIGYRHKRAEVRRHRVLIGTGYHYSL